MYVKGVDNVITPTTGGDVYAFNGNVNTQTAMSGGLVYGALFAGEQSGVGGGLLVNHNGTAGRNAEFNIINTANTDAAIFAINEGQGEAIIGQNQNNNITGTVFVADFSYTGTDVTDHVGASGYSQPAAGWGIGLLGEGGWYGMFSIGNTGAVGTKAFTIDHPNDPENKILKHFSIESNEVLNMYRGTHTFDGNGRVTVHLPDYYDAINKNPSYQLTPIGAAMPNLYIETEVNNGTFVIAGGVPSKKVSWQITAERNDPYLQQKPNSRDVIVEKEGERRGKYLMPELYGQPKEKGMFFRETLTSQKPNKINNRAVEMVEKEKEVKQVAEEEGVEQKN